MITTCPTCAAAEARCSGCSTQDLWIHVPLRPRDLRAEHEHAGLTSILRLCDAGELRVVVVHPNRRGRTDPPLLGAATKMIWAADGMGVRIAPNGLTSPYIACLARRVMPPSALHVVYIGGYGHSGSTLLNILLGRLPQMMGAGELFRLAAAWSQAEFCSCGQHCPLVPSGARSCGRWSASCRRRPSRPIPSPAARLRTMADAQPPDSALWEDYAGHTARPVCGHSARSPAGRPSSIPPRFRPGAGAGAVPGSICGWCIWCAMAAASPGRCGAARAGSAGWHPVGKHERSVSRTGTAWMATNLAVERTRAKLGRTTARSVSPMRSWWAIPAATLARLAAVPGDRSTPLVERVGRRAAPLLGGHVMAGNRMRMDGALRLRPDRDWQLQLPAGAAAPARAALPAGPPALRLPAVAAS